MRDTLIVLLLALPGIVLALDAWYAFRLRRVVNAVNVLRTDAQREEYKSLLGLADTLGRLVRVLFTSCSVLFAIGLFTDVLEIGDVLYAIGPNLPVLLFCMWLRPIEQRARALKTEVPAFAGR